MRLGGRNVRAALGVVAMTGAIEGVANAAGTVSIPYQFTGGSDGDGQGVALATAAGGPLPAGSIVGVGGDAGTVAACAGSRCGGIFSLVPAARKSDPYTFTLLYSFGGGADGGKPAGDKLLVGPGGALYGTARYGGTQAYLGGGGVVWRLSPPSGSGAWTYSVLWSFDPATDPAGYAPVAGLAVDSAGVLYGLTTKGAAAGAGAVFSLTPPAAPATTWTETVLKTFTAQKPGIASSAVRAPTLSANGMDLFGLAATNGTIFDLHRTPKTVPPWTYRTIFAFTRANVVLSNLTLYPSTPAGHVFGIAAPAASKGGEAFELTPPTVGRGPWTFADVFDFNRPRSPIVAGSPVGGIVQGTNTFELLGTVGIPGNAVYRLAPPPPGSTAWVASTVALVDSPPPGAFGASGVYAGPGGSLIGVSTSGGVSNKGFVFKVTR